MEKIQNTRRVSVDNENQIVIDNNFCQTVKNTVFSVLRSKEVGDWMGFDQMEEIAAAALSHIYIRVGQFDPSKGTADAWTRRVAHNFAITESKKLHNCMKMYDKNIQDSELVDMDGETPEQLREPEDYPEDFTIAWDYEDPEINADLNVADDSFDIEAEEAASMKRLETLNNFLVTSLNDREKKYLQMKLDDFTKEQMMAELNMNGGNFDTFKSRFVSKVRNFMRSVDYWGIE